LLLTTDKNIRYQQNLKERTIANPLSLATALASNPSKQNLSASLLRGNPATLLEDFLAVSYYL
jgi:hypothetical protein